jgi:Fe-S-cluster containining protein
MISRPVLSCDDCGACCRHVGTPPFVYLHPSLYDQPPPVGWGDDDPEVERWATAPPESIAILADYYAGTEVDRGERGLPCLWYDAASKRCRFYEYRPEVCREFEVGGEDCLRIRTEILR